MQLIQLCLIALISTLLLITVNAEFDKRAIDEYVWRPDSNYKWELVSSWKGKWGLKGYTGYRLNLTSQAWLTDADFSPESPSKSIWNHILLVLVPDEIVYKSNATLYITGGDTGLSDPEGWEETKVSLSLATSTGIVTGVLFQIPNERTIFAADPIQKSRSEDAIIAFTWDHYLNDPTKPEWLVRFPMVKASLRALDAITEFCAKQMPEQGLQIDYYTVAGASKRGWTTWLVGAVDPKRVVAIVPIVLDAINFVEFSHHQYKSYNGWADALGDYLDMNIMQRLDVPAMRSLQMQEDPYMFRERLTMPKLIINAGMDEFQMPDDSQFWWDQMPEPKHLMMVPNAEHSLATGILEVVPAVATWISALLEDHNVPTFSWTIDSNTGAISVVLDERGIVEEVNGWAAKSCGINNNSTDIRRDWRAFTRDAPCTCGIASDGNCINFKALWEKTTLQEVQVNGKRTYNFHVDAPAQGYVAYFIEVRYKKHKIPNKDAVSLESVAGDSASRLKKLLETAKDFKNLWKSFKFPDFPVDIKKSMVFTSQISVFPRTYPFEDCIGDPAAGDKICNNIRR